MIKNVQAELVIMAIQANALRKKINTLTKNFDTVSKKCEWYITGNQCCNENHHQKGLCGLMQCPVTEIKGDPNA